MDDGYTGTNFNRPDFQRPPEPSPWTCRGGELPVKQVKAFPPKYGVAPRQGVPAPGGAMRASLCLSALRAVAAVLQVVRANVPRIPACGALRRHLKRRASILQNPQAIAAFG